VSGPLASWLLAHLPAEATRTDRLVGTILALDANHDGNGADQTRGQMAELAGASPSAVSRSLRRLTAWRFLAAGPERPGRERPRLRMILVRWCPPEDGCQPCAQLVRWHRKVAASDNPSGRKVVTGAPKGGHQWQPLRNEGRFSDQQRLARLTAEANIRAADRSPNGQRPGDVPPSPDPSRVVSKLPTRYPTPHQDGSTASHPVRSRPALVTVRAPGGAAPTTSRDPPGASIGDPVLHPSEATP
jgi:hypothetical protein